MQISFQTAKLRLTFIRTLHNSGRKMEKNFGVNSTAVNDLESNEGTSDSCTSTKGLNPSIVLPCDAVFRDLRNAKRFAIDIGAKRNLCQNETIEII